MKGPIASLFFALSGILFSQQVSAEQRSPQAFQAPNGYEVRESKTQDFGAFAMNGRFDCMENGKWSKCKEDQGPFDTNGHLRIDGKIETTSYKPLSDRSTNYLLYLNFKRSILQAGGHHVAQYRDGDETKGFFAHLLVIERDGVQRWVLFDAYGANQKHPAVTVITITDVPNILAAVDLQHQLDAQGFATLHVNFDNNMAVVRQDSEPTLNEVVKLMKSSQKLRLSVEGHTDNIGAPRANKELSEQRAKSITDYLIRNGVQAARLQAVGHGQESPIADNRKEEGRAQNRRVELVKLP